MGDHIPLPRRLSDIHLDDTSDVELKSSERTRRQRDQSNIITFEAPKGSRRLGDQSNIITFGNPAAERSPSPSSRYPSAMDFRDFDRMEERRLEELRQRGSYRSESEEVKSLRRQLHERDDECHAQRAWIKELEREVKQLRQQLSMFGAHHVDERTTYIKVHQQYLATETLERFNLPWEYDPVSV